MYKINVKDNKKNLLFFKYFDKRKDAIIFRDDYNSKFSHKGYKAELQSKSVKIKYHHTALTRGYICKGHGYDESYQGKYGLGFRRHIENSRSSVSNNYHYIEYYVEVK
jgi:hypothetical protein